MDKNADLYDLTQLVQGTMYQAGQKQYLTSLNDEERDNQPQRPALLSVRGGYAESIGWLMVQLLEFDPEPLTVEKFRVRAVYSAPRLSQGLLELIASEKWAHRNGDEYALTGAGRQMMRDLISHRNQMFKSFEPLPADELAYLVDVSHKIIDAALSSGDKHSTWCLWHSQNRKPSPDVSAIAKLIHVCSDYNAWRDDTHMAAYKEQEVDGMTWEAFSFVDDKNASTATALFDQLAYRGWTIDEWQNALNCLVDKGWIETDGNSYQSTQRGQSVRKLVEQKTDALFFAPWDVLTQEAQVAYISLLNKLNDTCTTLIRD